jgi:hypothetical protein
MTSRNETCPKCKNQVPAGTIVERRSFTVYAGKFCENCCRGYRDHCGLDQPQGDPAILDEPLEPEPYYGSSQDIW